VLQAQSNELTGETNELVQHFRLSVVKKHRLFQIRSWLVVVGCTRYSNTTLIQSGLKREAKGVLTTPSVKISV
jgi:hypothetical protein